MSLEKHFNFLNFFYGVGATIILVAAMFKFLGFPYANYVFVFGILVEAIVFLISSFSWSGKDKSYNWEKVFPQLDENGEHINSSNISLAEGTQQQQVQKIMETVITLNGSVNELNAATQKLTKSVTMMEQNYDTVTESTKKYQTQIDSLREKIASANDNLKGFENFNFNKDK
jgi:gliding motility-associated protein GldL